MIVVKGRKVKWFIRVTDERERAAKWAWSSIA